MLVIFTPLLISSVATCDPSICVIELAEKSGEAESGEEQESEEKEGKDSSEEFTFSLQKKDSNLARLIACQTIKGWHSTHQCLEVVTPPPERS